MDDDAKSVALKELTYSACDASFGDGWDACKKHYGGMAMSDVENFTMLDELLDEFGIREECEEAALTQMMQATNSLKFKRLPHGEGLPLPSYRTAGAAGMDICAAEDIVLGDDPELVPTGFAVEVPDGYELQVRPRSGLSLQGICICNAPGTIDSDYRGEIKIIMASPCLYPLERGDRMAQLVLAPIHRMPIIEVVELSETVRGEGGFGSTGK